MGEIVDLLLSLPQDIKEDVTKRVELEDRLTMRTLCRGLNNLCAETNAGFCGRGWIQLGDNKAFIKLGELEINTSNSTEYKLEQILQFRKRHFNRIAFERFRILLDDNEYSLPFLLKFTENFQTEELFIKASSDLQLKMAAALFSGFTRSKRGISLDYCPDTETLLSLPQMEHIEISFGSEEISSELFFALLNTHKNIRLDCANVRLTSQEWERSMETISSDTHDRTIEFTANHASIVHWLSDCGIDQLNVNDAVCGENRFFSNQTNCWTTILYFSGTERQRQSTVRISKDRHGNYQRLFDH